jgi:hypothetical protein
MTVRKATPLLLAAALATWSCSGSPVSPSTTGIGSGLDIQAKGNPNKPGDDSTMLEYIVTFGTLASNEQVLSNGNTLLGTVTGSDGTLVASLAGLATLTFTGLRELPNAPDECDGIGAVSGLIGTPLSGQLTVSVDADGTNQWPFALLDWQMTGISVGADEWRIEGLTTVNYSPTLVGDAAGFTATQFGSKVFFKRYPNGGRKSDLSSGACRVDILMTVVPK